MESPQAQQEARAAKIKELAYEMSRQDVSATLSDSGLRRQAFAYAKATAKEFEAAVDELAALSQSPQPASQPVELTERKSLEECCEMLDELRWSSEESADPAYVELRGRIRASSARAWTLLYAAPQPEPADTKDATCPHCGKSINWMCHGIAMKDTRP